MLGSVQVVILSPAAHRCLLFCLSGCKADLGGFAGLFDLKAAGFVDPILVSGTDGVGTKLKACGQHGGLGQDLVAMCVNDVLAQGAEPLFFLDYFSCGNLNVEVAASVVGGVAKACEMAGCALLGKNIQNRDDLDVTISK
ncbi:hypothetical protein GOODEAATRI_031720 [Goodea atripinnis]|uniref:PurM-like N-terminal domain-containing protein n=1 Tax=Goodea atripinnis TaxID=208336 RepID=A0ABV0PT94_9TELE